MRVLYAQSYLPVTDDLRFLAAFLPAPCLPSTGVPRHAGAAQSLQVGDDVHILRRAHDVPFFAGVVAEPLYLSSMQSLNRSSWAIVHGYGQKKSEQGRKQRDRRHKEGIIKD